MDKETILQILREVADPGKVDPVYKDEVGMLSLDELERYSHRMMAEGVKMVEKEVKEWCDEVEAFAIAYVDGLELRIRELEAENAAPQPPDCKSETYLLY